MIDGFRLDGDFVEGFRRRPVRWGFGPLSWVTYVRTYSRDGEEWWETCRRVIEGMFTVQGMHCAGERCAWDERRAQGFAREAYARMWEFKWTPPGRGLWIMGTPFMYERGGAALNNCGFVSTKDIASDYAAPYLWVLKMSMLGVGVGFDTRGKGQVTIEKARVGDDVHRIKDSREGWGEALGRMLNAYAGKGTLPARWDYEEIRPRGARLRSFGGVASGPGPLRGMMESVGRLHEEHAGKRVDAGLIVDTMNMIGRCVVAGGIRRSAQIAFGEAGDEQFLDLKMDRAKLEEYRWVSNNSIVAKVGMDYRGAARRTAVNGEPGYFWLENARAYGRMGDGENWADERAEGSNPCVEQTLWNKELCCLVETFPAHHENFEDYKRTLQVAYQYAKTVTLVAVEDEETRAVMERNRRIGCSMSGIVQAITKLGAREFFRWCDEGYEYVQQLDEKYSRWLKIARSIKTTSVKPSGTVSILAGATPGVHWEHAPYYIRRVRVTQDHRLVEMCREAGYGVEPDHYGTNAMVVSFPVHIANTKRGKGEVSLREKVELAAQMQEHWSDNQVSCTADFDPETEGGELPKVLGEYEKRLKAMVFLPSREHGYEQPPYEEITREEYEAMTAKVKPMRGELEHEEELEGRFCEGGLCEVE